MNGLIILRSVVLLASAACLTACGGGGSEPAAPATMADFAGIYSGNATATRAVLIVHPDGTAVGMTSAGGLADGSPYREQAFAGNLAVKGALATSTDARFVFTNWNSGIPTTTTGSGDVTLTRIGTEILKVDVSRASPPGPFAWPTYTRSPSELSGVSLGSDRYWNPAVNYPETQVNLDVATGALTGQYFPDCQISGRVYGYDSATTLFRLDATFTGAGCAVRELPTGAGQFVGHRGTFHATSIIRISTLSAYGFIGNRFVTIELYRI